MCGIGSITFDKTVAPSVAARLDLAVSELLAALDSRGGDACGLLTVSAAGKVRVQKAPCNADDFNSGRLPVQPDTRAVAVHTRFATQGAPHWNRNNHPVRCGSAHVLHNGVIYDRCTRVQGDPEVDTYALAIAAENASGIRKGESALQRGERIAADMADEDGSAAVLVAFTGEPTLITARLCDSPLYVAEAHGVRIAASTLHAVGMAADALEIALPTEASTKTVWKKTKKGKGPKKSHSVPCIRERIDFAPEGTVLVWSAGTHSAGAVTLPVRIYAPRSWKASGIGADAAATAPADWDSWEASGSASYAAIAERLLAADEDGLDCELCGDWSGETKRAHGLDICPDCFLQVMPDPDTYADTGEVAAE